MLPTGGNTISAKSTLTINDGITIDPNDFIMEQMNKPPCRRYMQTRHCDYRLDCKYSHVRIDHRSGKPLFPEELLEWLDAKATEQAQPSNHQPIDNKAKPSPTYKLPSGLSVKDLPPSLKPPPIGKDFDWTSTATWG
ncbi:hypothetical protein [Absidia glauca]|uniref:C3H1-type domain-containing protein n=1 Tax=Absidia glauca TaxID=4829 RepID=A0A163MV86_ABSGL|nr:hypothetical protein [Absidia glauca]